MTLGPSGVHIGYCGWQEGCKKPPAADFNGDGKLDLAVTSNGSNTVSILLGNGDGTFTQAAGSPIPVGNTPDALAVGDFLGSGKLGLAVANFTDNTVTILVGNGDGTFMQTAGSPVAVGKGRIPSRSPTSMAAAGSGLPRPISTTARCLFSSSTRTRRVPCAVTQIGDCVWQMWGTKSLPSELIGHSAVETPAGVKFSTYGLPVTRLES